MSYGGNNMGDLGAYGQQYGGFEQQPGGFQAEAPGLQQGGKGGAGAFPAVGAHSTSNVLKLKGIPWSATEEQLYQFFQGYQISKAYVLYQGDGRPSGMAFAEFATPEAATEAMALNNEYIEDRYVKLLQVPRQEMEQQLGSTQQGMQALRDAGHVVPDVQPGWGGQGGMNQGMGGYGGGGFRGGYGGGGGGFDNFQFRGKGGGKGGYGGGKGGYSNNRPQMAGGFGGKGGGGGGSPPFPIAGTGSTVKLRGLPFRVSQDELLEFFTGYAAVPSSLQMGTDASGRSSGEAWITFSTPEEAARAVQERNREYIGNRYVELTVV